MSGHPNMPLLSQDTEQAPALRAEEPGFCPEIGKVCLNATETIDSQIFNNHPFNVDLAIIDCTFSDTGFCAVALRRVASMNEETL